MRRTSSVDGYGHCGSVRFGWVGGEVVEGQGSADCSGLRTVGYGLMMAGIGGCYVRACVGLDAGSPGPVLIEAIDAVRIDAGCIYGGYGRCPSVHVIGNEL